MSFSAEEIAALAVHLSPERLAALNNLTGSTDLAVELHQETLRLGASLMCVTATIEIALRNTVCDNLARHFGSPAWLVAPPAPFTWRDTEEKSVSRALDSARRAEYSKLSQADKAALDAAAFPRGRPANLSHLGRAKARRQQMHVTTGKVVAELTLHFWKRLFGPEYEHSLWRPTLKATFPNKRISRASVATHLENVYQSRNRLAHHEPVLHKRFDDTLEAVEFIIENLNASSRSAETPLAKLLATEIAGVKAKSKELHDRLAAFRLPATP